MDEHKMLSQEEIDALLKGPPEETVEDSGAVQSDGPETAPEDVPATPGSGNEAGLSLTLDKSEMDALGEIGNISMGSASTTLSELLRQKVSITSPVVKVIDQKSLFDSFQTPYIIIQVEFKEGLTGYNILVIRLRDAIVMSNLMMGGDGEIETEEITELEISAASEAMNQMIGSASTSMATMFGRQINISPPVSSMLSGDEKDVVKLPIGDEIVTINFKMKIGDLLDTEIMQVLSIETAKKEAALLWETMMGTSSDDNDELIGDDADAESILPPDGDAAGSFFETEPEAGPGAELSGESNLREEKEADTAPTGPAHPVGRPQAPPFAGSPYIRDMDLSNTGLTQVEQRKMELLLDVPLKVSVVLGRTKRPIKEVLNLTPGAIVELNSLVDEPVEVLVNGTLVARGEVVVVNENFGVRINSILSPEERIRQLKG